MAVTGLTAGVLARAFPEVEARIQEVVIRICS
jgi:hypothetical protein